MEKSKDIEALADKHAKDKHLIKGYTGTYDLETSLQLSAQIENSKQGFIAGYNAANEWVKCSDRLPQRGVVVLCINTQGYMKTGAFYPDNTYFSGDDAYDNITHWRHLPTPPTT